MNEFNLNDHSNSIAIIALSGRFPGAKNIDEYWDNLANGIESIQSLSVTENISSQKNRVNASGYLDDIDKFDAEFFGFSPKEAEIMDPQQRLLLETCVDALEMAGYCADQYQGRIGVYLGAAISTYLLFNLLSRKDLHDSFGMIQISNGNDSISTPVSYKLNLTGPSVDINTTCSTSLVAVHQACRSLLGFECDMALAGGVSINVLQNEGYLYQEGGILSPDGHCRPFDADAKGTVEGCGLGVVILKRLEDALEDGDTIHAIIRSSAINNDGANKVGYTAPSVDGQASVIAEALQIANVSADTISYVEAHGTGTTLGDPIEIAALTKAFRFTTDNAGYCAIGSVKSNIGHLNTASGVAGLIKTILALKNKKIPASLHYKQANPKINFSNSPFYVNTKLADWETTEYTRRAGVSSFGMGGTNAHLILEEAPAVYGSISQRKYHLLHLSAKTETALQRYKANLGHFLENNNQFELADIAYTLLQGRKEYRYKSILVARERSEASDKLLGKNNQFVLSSHDQGPIKEIIFMFPGQGSQYQNMAIDLYQCEPIFKDQVDNCCEQLFAYLNLDLRSILFNTSSHLLNKTHITQCALFTIEYSLAKLLEHYGIKPYAMIGHSIGEYVAATIAEVFTLKNALKLVAMRGKLMQSVAPGKMMTVKLSLIELNKLLKPGVSIAAHNANDLCVVSGDVTGIDDFQYALSQLGVETKILHTSHAFHSAMMDDVLDQFKACFTEVELNAPKIPFISNLSGDWITQDVATDHAYWVKHLRQTVKFKEGIDCLLSSEKSFVLLEVGPGQTLGHLAKQANNVQQSIVLNTLPHPRESTSSEFTFLDALGKMWLNSANINWSNIYLGEKRLRVPLPTYPFEHQSYWIEKSNHHSVVSANDPTNKNAINNWMYVPTWKRLHQTSTHSLNEMQDGYWIILCDDSDISTKLISNHRFANKKVYTIKPGINFQKLSATNYKINPSSLEDYQSVLSEIIIDKSKSVYIINLWNVSCIKERISSQTETASSFYYLLSLAQAIIKQKMSVRTKLFIITDQMYRVIGDERIDPMDGMLQGITKSLTQEYNHIQYKHIDLQLNDDFAETIISEITENSSLDLIAYRNGYRWQQVLEPYVISRTTSANSLLRMGGVYLITGGLGNIGLIVAKALIEQYQAKLILVGRTLLRDASEWNILLSDNAIQPEIKNKIIKLQEITHISQDILVLQGDVSDYEQMENVFKIAENHFGKIHGVIHAAGDVSSGSFQMIDMIQPTDCQRQFSPKIDGLKVLSTLIEDRNLDFVCLFSSIASQLAGFGHTSYSAANIFMDMYAHSVDFHINKTPIININWDAWYHGNESNNQLSGNQAALIDTAIYPKEGIQVLFNIINHAIPNQYIISTTDLQQRYDQWINHSNEKEISDNISLNVNTIHTRPNLLTPYAAARDSLEQDVIVIWETLLGISGIGIYDNFFELGGHSLLATQLTSRIRETYDIEFSLQALFENPTVSQMAVEIMQRKTSEIDDELMEQLLSEVHG